MQITIVTNTIHPSTITTTLIVLMILFTCLLLLSPLGLISCRSRIDDSEYDNFKGGFGSWVVWTIACEFDNTVVTEVIGTRLELFIIWEFDNTVVS